MKKYILGAVLFLGLLVSPAFVPQAEAAALSATQISAIIGLLQAFGADQSVIANVQAALSGGSTTPPGTAPTALITINGQLLVTNADPLVSRTWAWSGTSGATYSASGNITGCENTSQNGPQPDWKPWIGGTGSASSGSSSAIPGAVKYGCTIVGTYNVTNAAGETAIGIATITFKHANGSANPLPVDTGGLTITTQGTLHPIQSDHFWNFDLAYTGGTGTPTWSLVSGSLPATMELDPVKGTISNTKVFNTNPISVNNHIPEGTYPFTVKVTDGSQSATKQLSLEVRPLSDTRPIINTTASSNGYFAVNEFINGNDAGIPGTYHFYYSPKTENDVCTIVSGQLPSGIIMKTSSSGCMLSGAPTDVGTYPLTWKIQNQYGSDTAEYPITVYMPDKQLTLLTSGFPAATVGEPYSATLKVGTTGNWTGSRIGFTLVWGLGGNPGGPPFSDELGLWDIYNNSVQTITTPEPTDAQKTAVISGTPSKAGTYQLKYCAGNGTEHHAAFCMENYAPLIVKPRIQTPADLNAAIVSAMNSLNWSAAHSVQSATSFKATMQQEGWTLNDVAIATGDKLSDVVNTLYPVGADLRGADAVGKRFVIQQLIQDDIRTFNWSDANKHQSAISLKALMDQKGWTSSDVQYSFPFTLGSQDPILTEILKAYASGTAAPTVNLVASVSNSASGPFTANGTAVYNNLPVYARITSAGVNMKSYAPKGCIQPAGTSGCSSDSGYRDYLPSEWLDNSTIQTIVQDPSIYPLTTYELYIKFPGGSPIEAGSFALIASQSQQKQNALVLTLTTLSPSGGNIGTTVTINGSGFTGTNSIYLNGSPVDTLNSSGGSTPTWISFVIPTNLPSCPSWNRLCVPGPALTSGTYTVSVQNTNGTSNAVSLGVN